MELQHGQFAAQTQKLLLGQEAQQSLRFLAMPRAELRQAVLNELAMNPVVEERAQSNTESLDALLDTPSPSYDYDPPDLDAYGGFSAEDAERREHFFNSRTARESLAGHLLRQIPLAGFSPREASLARELISQIDSDGYFRGSFPDLEMTTRATRDELERILAQIRLFDPEGCGSRNLAECYLSQLDKLRSTHLANEARAVILHLDALAAGRTDEVCAAANIAPSDLPDVLDAIKSLDPFPGRAFAPPKTAERIEIDVALFKDRAGRWKARARRIDAPRLEVNRRYVRELEKQDISPEMREFLKEKIARVEEINTAIARRGETLERIALILARIQGPYLSGESNILKPLTIRAIAPEIGVHETTISRAVAGKWMKTPRGIIRMRDLFASGIVAADGEVISRSSVEERLKAIIASEDKSHPLSDEKIASRLSSEGFPVARRTVAKYRDALGIPGKNARKIG